MLPVYLCSWFVDIPWRCSLEQTAVFCSYLVAKKKKPQKPKFNTMVFKMDEYKAVINSAVSSEKDIFFWSSS